MKLGDARKRKILAVASAGGHWTELLRLRPAFEGCAVVYVTTMQNAGVATGGAPCHFVLDGNRGTPLRLLRMFFQLLFLLRRERPDVIVSTGAAPGFLAVLLGKLLGARTVWLESVANADALSLSTRLALPVADLTLTQWPHMARPRGPFYKGSVL